ncbi:hypothetical protein PPTG_00378 [Phytophthora nicotianae INRA-310]|uniref:Uncharacterized protein n=3 Tax=Phytophthora nicotianae TaxID=4792 RepID=W2RGW6_PHYN3|nr:hypothetical protein PPTG_00378 [Phytophthora nicotianae INRA-310]ETN23879.1 hypothetical protein PPTG_00378 [Phytophthora nicotianae INRA-310]KUF81765.1 hypothetical protein AM587_10013675 [Phytophthora nicotianae]
MCCGFRALEFALIWLSAWSAGMVAVAIFQIESMQINGQRVGSSDGYESDSSLDSFFNWYALTIALSFTVTVKIVMCCWHSKNCIKEMGRRAYMLGLSQVVKISVMVISPIIAYRARMMKLKTNEELEVGMCLFTCEFLSAVIEFSQATLIQTTKKGARVWIKNFADFTSAQMIAAQFFEIEHFYFLVTALMASFVIATCLARKYGKDSSEYEAYVIWAGLGVGLVEGLVVQEAVFKDQDEIFNYALLFALTLILPAIKKKYHKVEIPDGYKFSYHKSQDTPIHGEPSCQTPATEYTQAPNVII